MENHEKQQSKFSHIWTHPKHVLMQTDTKLLQQNPITLLTNYMAEHQHPLNNTVITHQKLKSLEVHPILQWVPRVMYKTAKN